MTVTTLLIEDHATMRATLSKFVSKIDDVELIGAVSSGEEALEFCAQVRPRLALIDVSLPGINGIDLVLKLQNLNPGITCLMLSGHHKITYVQRALANGASGYVLKGDPEELLEAIKLVIAGKTYLNETLRTKLRTREQAV